MKNIFILPVLALCLTGCIVAPKKIQTQSAHNKTWTEMFDGNGWSAVNSAKITETNKVVK